MLNSDLMTTLRSVEAFPFIVPNSASSPTSLWRCSGNERLVKGGQIKTAMPKVPDVPAQVLVMTLASDDCIKRKTRLKRLVPRIGL